MKVIVAANCGFCPGVKNAIRMAEEILKKKAPVYCLGSIIHNKDMVEKLAKLGMKTVDNLGAIGKGTVLIRSHGAALAEIKKLRQKGLKIVDATCVLVKRVQQIAKKLDKQGFTVVVIGDENHPEVKAVVGYAKNVVIVASELDLHKLPKNKKLGIIGQTTQGIEKFGKIIGAIAQQGFSELRVINTLCRETIKRQESAVELCKKVDVMFVLGGLDSANTRKLVELCKKNNNLTFHLQNWQEFDKKLSSGKTTAGVTAGASTPEWIVEEFVENLKKV